MNLIEGIMLLLQSTSTHLFVVCLAIYAIARLGFRAYENTFQKEDASEKSQTMKIHLLYIAGILLFIIIEITSYLAIKSDPRGESLMQYISFASTLASIILSILAIILTIVTTSKGDSTVIKVEQATKKLEEALLNLEGISEQYDEKIKESYKSLQNAKETLQNTSSEIKKDLSTTFVNMKRKLDELDTNVCASKDEISRLGSSIEQLKSTEITSEINQHKLEALDCQTIVNIGSFLGNIGLLVCCMAVNKGITSVQLRKINQHEGYITGYLIALSTIGMVEISIQEIREEGTTLSITSVHEDVKEENIRKILYNYINNEVNQEYLDENQTTLSSVNKYFEELKS